MSTNSSIAIMYRDGTIESVYCHWDGYLSHNGRILAECYNHYTKVMSLINEGDISSLDETIDESEFYHRDFREDRHSNEWDNYKEYTDNVNFEFNYIYKPTDNNDYQWFVNGELLSKALVKEGIECDNG